VFASFFCLFVICHRRLTFSSSSRVFLRATEVSRKGRRRERGRRGELTDPFAIQSEMSDWRSSTVRHSVLESFIEKGFLPP